MLGTGMMLKLKRDDGQLMVGSFVRDLRNRIVGGKTPLGEKNESPMPDG
jgi:hypothetical protein